ncbi:cobyric acid synthase CobQ, partial [Mycobacterium sp. ITM-2017-0098]
VEEFPGGGRSGAVFGTMWHGAFEGDALRASFLRESLGLTPSGVSFSGAREARLDLLGDLVEHHLDVDALIELATHGAPEGLPFLPPGAP